MREEQAEACALVRPQHCQQGLGENHHLSCGHGVRVSRIALSSLDPTQIDEAVRTCLWHPERERQRERERDRERETCASTARSTRRRRASARAAASQRQSEQRSHPARRASHCSKIAASPCALPQPLDHRSTPNGSNGCKGGGAAPPRQETPPAGMRQPFKAAAFHSRTAAAMTARTRSPARSAAICAFSAC